MGYTVRLDSDIATQTATGGFRSLTFTNNPIFPSIDDTIALRGVLGSVSGSSNAKMQLAQIGATLIGSQYALNINDVSGGSPTALTASSPTAASVGVASAAAVAANTSRKGLTLVNTSANTISLGFGAAAVLNSGITLLANGGTFVMDKYTFTTAAVNAIAGGAASNLAIQEFV